VTALGWRLNRLRAMGLAEIIWRIKQYAQSRLELAGIGRATYPAPPAGQEGVTWLHVLPSGFDVAPYRIAAERILSGRFDIFALHDMQLNFPPLWNRDPRTGTVAPLVFGKTLDYRTEALVGDIKYLWEPNRHLELTTLAQAFHLTGEHRYANGARWLLESWFDQCPYPLGPNWTSSLEHSVRLVNWSFSWHLLGGDNSPLFQGDAGERFRQRWLDSIFQHLHFVSRHFSRYSSANNHLLGEHMGLFIGTITWPLWRECAKWQVVAKCGMEREALNQNAADGVNHERATWYHHEVADMMLLCGLVGRASGIEFSDAYWARLASMLEYIASIMDITGHVPMFGDADDAVMVRFSQEHDFNAYHSLLASGAVLFARGDFKVKAGRFDDKSRWLLGDDVAVQFDNLPVENLHLPVRRAFPEGGYYILGDWFETAEEVRLVADAGPLGYLSIAAHGHADALSFTLSAKGKEILVDPGTYAYHTQKKWRDYFRGTSAHNTVRVDGVDQSVAGGNFLWVSHAQARCDKFTADADRDEWEGSHDGYLRLSAPVRHRRKIVFDKRRKLIDVTDTLEGTGRHKVELFWHFSEECAVVIKEGGVVARNGNLVSRFLAPEGMTIRLEHGNETLPLGWVSRHFDEKHAIATVVWEGEVEAGVYMRTLIHIEHP
jgi:hypothetical protein